MAKTANLNIRIDPEVKSQAEELLADFGMTITMAINLFLHKTLLEGGLPFQIQQPRYNAETEAAIQETRDIAAGKIKTKRFASFSEFLADLNEEDDD